MMPYMLWAGIVAAGALMAVFDWRLIRRPVLGVLLLAALCGGFITTQVSPFNFADGGYYLQGVIVAGGSALALIGYASAAVTLLAIRYFGRRRYTP